jgi:3-oxoadipate enol-lactonase
MTYLSLAGEDFHVRIEGPDNAPVLMMSNSLSSNLTMWDPQVTALKDRFRIIRYDSRGHGKSTSPARPYSIAELGRDALNILDALNISKAHWLGLSKGGMVGQWLVTHHGARLDKVILANTAARMGPPDLWNQRIRLVNAQGMQAIVEGTLERWFTKRFVDSGSPVINDVRKMVSATPAQGYTGCCAAIRDMDQREAISAIRNPVLVIVGAHDPATPPDAGALIASRITGAKLVTLDASHVSNLEQPDAFTKAVADFLAR